VNLDLRNGADYISAKIVVETAGRIYRNVSGVPEYILTYTKNLFVWQDLFFWTDYFWDITAKEIQKRVDEIGILGEVYSLQQKAFLKVQIEQFGAFLCGWGDLPLETRVMFCENIAEEAGLTKEQVASITDSLLKPKEKNKGASKWFGSKKKKEYS